jgi:cation diffusion facilitator family transporter
MDKAKAGYVEGFVSIIINSVLFVLRLWAGIVTGSIALVADAWHTLSDSISSVVVVIAAKLSSKKADKKHPFGHGRWEQIASLFIAVFLGIVAYEFFRSAIVQFSKREAVQYGSLAIIVTVVSIIVKELLAQYAFYLGKKSDNNSVKADGWHHRTDALASVVVLIGILFAKQFWWIDSVLGIIVALMIFYAAFEILKETITKMLGEEPEQDLIEKIIAEAKDVYKNDLRLHHIHIHDYVLHKELTLHIRLENSMSIEEGHKIATEIEKRIMDKYELFTTIHVEPLYK